MAMNYVPLDKAVHKDIKLSTKNDFALRKTLTLPLLQSVSLHN